nr:uncharacterized protein LOC124816098 [Hydra vulgaris]
MSLLEGGDRRRYNLPSHDEVAVVFAGEDGSPPTSREAVIYPRGHPLKIVSRMSPNLDPMVYPLFSQEQYDEDAYVKIKGQRLAFIRNNQNKLGSGQYDALHEHINNIANDHLFITFTCKPKWREITENLYPGQNANDRPDFVTRVFKLKLNNLLNDIFKHGVLGKVVTHVQVIEFQKRGLPHAHILHAHILLHSENDDKLETSQDIEIPDPIVNRELYDIIKTCMIHGPRGILNPNSPSMKDGVCSKNYPKDFNANTVAIHNGYPRHRRCDNGLYIEDASLSSSNNEIVEVSRDNESMVSDPSIPQPVAPYLLGKSILTLEQKLDATICNVKQVEKAALEDISNLKNITKEIKLFEATGKRSESLKRIYVSAPEAQWRIFEYPISHMSHTIIRLKDHLPENQIVYFREGGEQVALDRAAQRDTHLTAWFKLNSENEGAHRYSYVDIPYYFVFDDKHCKWKVLFILAEQATLLQMEKIINQSGKTLSDYNLPVVDEFIDFNLENLNDYVQQSISEANRMRPLLNVNQLNVSNAVLAALNEQPSVESQHSRLFFYGWTSR